MTRRIRRVVAVAGVGGEVPPLEELLGGFPEAGDDAVAVVGDLGAAWSKADACSRETLTQQAAV
jgi:hypothetical protein